MMRILFLTLFVWSGLVFASDQALSNAQANQYTALIEELRCLVCQNQNIAESNAPLAVDLKRQVREMILEGRSDSEIKDYLIARYGDFVLYRPPFKPLTWLLWLGPFVLLGFGLFIALRVFRGKTPAISSGVDDQKLAELLESHHSSPDDEKN